MFNVSQRTASSRPMDKSVIYRNSAMETVNVFLVPRFEGAEPLNFLNIYAYSYDSFLF